MQLCTHCKYQVEVKIDRQLGQWKDKGMTIQDCYLSPNRQRNIEIPKDM